MFCCMQHSFFRVKLVEMGLEMNIFVFSYQILVEIGIFQPSPPHSLPLHMSFLSPLHSAWQNSLNWGALVPLASGSKDPFDTQIKKSKWRFALVLGCFSNVTWGCFIVFHFLSLSNVLIIVYSYHQEQMVDSCIRPKNIWSVSSIRQKRKSAYHETITNLI